MIRTNWLMAAVVCCSAMTLACCGKSDQASIQGTWQVNSMQVGGQKMPIPADKTATMTITSDTISVSDKKDDDGKYTLNSSASPKQLDLTPTQGSDKGKTLQCLYDLNGDTLKICFPEDPTKRPTSFDAKDAMVMELARKK